MNVYSSNNKELPKATTQQGTPRSNIMVRSAQKQPRHARNAQK